MYSPLEIGFKYVSYLITAKNGKGHGIHSPFVFDFVTQVLNDEGIYYCYEVIETQRRNYLGDTREIEVVDLGAGSRKDKNKSRKVGDIARYALKPPKFSQLLFRIANYYKINHILELGTSLGITTSYLAMASHTAKVLTLEGVPGIAKLAMSTFSQTGANNIGLLEGNFDNTLEIALQKMPRIDLAYLDGNHRLEPTLRYFHQMKPHLHENTILIFDDIHWSKEMEEAWKVVQSDPDVTLSIDLFYIGLVFFKKDFKVKQHFSIRF